MKRINYLFYPNEEDKVEHPTRTAKETKKKKEEKKKKKGEKKIRIFYHKAPAAS